MTGELPALNFEQDCPLVIEPVANGFIVKSSWRDDQKTMYVSEVAPPPMVFQTMTELLHFLQVHFTHRTPAVTGDGGEFQG